MGSYGTHGALTLTRYIQDIDVDLFAPVSESIGCKRQLTCLDCAGSSPDLGIQGAPEGCSANIIMVEQIKSVIKCLGVLMRHARLVSVKFRMALSRIPLSDSNFKFLTLRRISIVVCGPAIHPTRESNRWMRRSQALFKVILHSPSGNWARGNPLWST